MKSYRMRIIILKEYKTEENPNQEVYSFKIDNELRRKFDNLLSTGNHKELSQLLKEFEDIDGNPHSFDLDEVMGFEFFE